MLYMKFISCVYIGFVFVFFFFVHCQKQQFSKFLLLWRRHVIRLCDVISLYIDYVTLQMSMCNVGQLDNYDGQVK